RAQFGVAARIQFQPHRDSTSWPRPIHTKTIEPITAAQLVQVGTVVRKSATSVPSSAAFRRTRSNFDSTKFNSLSTLLARRTTAATTSFWTCLFSRSFARFSRIFLSAFANLESALELSCEVSADARPAPPCEVGNRSDLVS